MDLDLNGEQRSQLELISLYAGKPPAQVLVDAATFLVERDAGLLDSVVPCGPQTFIADDELDARFAQMLRR